MLLMGQTTYQQYEEIQYLLYNQLMGQ